MSVRAAMGLGYPSGSPTGRPPVVTDAGRTRTERRRQLHQALVAIVSVPILTFIFIFAGHLIGRLLAR
jgi:hypothetical protein